MKSMAKFSLFVVVFLAAALVGFPVIAGGVQENKVEEKVTLRLATWQWEEPGTENFYKESSQAFMEAHPNIVIEQYYFPHDKFWERFNVDMAAGSPPEILILEVTLFEYIAMKALEPLDDYLKGTDIVRKTRWQDTYPVKDGKTWAINLTARTTQMMCNMKLFNERGVKTPTTLEELETVAKKLTDPSKEQFGLVLCNSDHTRFWENLLVFVAGYGGHFAKDGRLTIDDPTTIKGVSYFKKLFDMGVMPKGVNNTAIARNWFNSGKAGMIIEEPWYLAELQKNAPDVLANLSIIANPTPTHAATGGVNTLIGIPSAAKHKDEAWLYLKFVCSDKWMQNLVRNSMMFSAREGTVTEEFLKENPYYAVFSQELGRGVQIAPPGLEKQYTKIWKLVARNVTGLLYENKDVTKVLQETQKEALGIIGM